MKRRLTPERKRQLLYKRLWKNSVEELVVPELDECFRWTAEKTANGYGRVKWRGKRYLVHRLTAAAVYGPLPPDRTVDHLCRVRDCWRPWHLEIVTNAENIHRGMAARGVQTHCKQGHPFDEANTIIRSDGSRRCRICDRERHTSWQREYRRKKRSR